MNRLPLPVATADDTADTGADAASGVDAPATDPACAPTAVCADIWQQLHAQARRQLRRAGRQDTLNATALVNEAWLKVADAGDGTWQSREHFVASMATVMRHLLIDRARSRAARKHGGDQQRITITGLDERASGESQVLDLVALDDALCRLRAVDPRLERVAELRFFGGLSVDETARALGLSSATVKRDARSARAFLSLLLDA
jgi:RNA polymerase sigma factor (TIGR02999 family)